MTDAPLIDRAILDELVGSIGTDGVRSVIELFIAESRLYLATIAAADADRGAARRAAHSLKSGAGQIGAAPKAAAAAAVECAAAEGGADLPQTVAVLDRCATDTAIALARFLRQ
jgi:HPt (histidine-containing phosphotransfer) domain-containing protein